MITSLTGVRGVAALWVFSTHAQPVIAAYLHAPALARSTLLQQGFRGVDLFFVLSGFILMHVHAADFAVPRLEHVLAFYRERALRVYPLNAVVLLVLVPLALALPGFVAWTRYGSAATPYTANDFSPLGFVQTLLLAQDWTLAKCGEWNGPSWSLSAEVAGYAIFPLLAHLALRCRTAYVAAGTAAGSLVLLVVLMRLSGHATDNPTGTFGLVRMACCFAAGVALLRCRMLLPNAGDSAGMLCVAALVVVAASLLDASTALFAVFGLAALVFGLSYGRGMVNALLCTRPALFFGRISFSFYLVHYIPLRLALWLYDAAPAGRGLDEVELGGGMLAGLGLVLRVACLLAVGGACLLLGTLVHARVERPLHRTARRLRHLRVRHPTLEAN